MDQILTFKMQTSIIVSLIALLAISVFANLKLLDKAKSYYAREQIVRLTAVDRRHAPDNARLPSKEEGTQRIILFGDSKCSQWSPLPTWENCEIINRGIGGETTAQIKERLHDDVIALKPDFVIFQAGVNDLKGIGVLPDLQNKITQDCVDNIASIATELNKHGIRVVLTTVMPPAPIELARTPLWSDQVNQSVDDTNQQLRKLGSPMITIFDCDQYFREGKHIKAEYSFDTLHLNKKGYQHWNESLKKFVIKTSD